MNKHLTVLLVITLFRLACASMAASTATEPPVVEVLVSYQEYDAGAPWQSNPTQSRRGFGLLMDPSYIVTTEVMVRNQTLIEIRRPRAGRKETATLILADPQINLALLRMANSTNEPSAIAVPEPSIDTETVAAEIVQIGANGELQIGRGRIAQWKVSPFAESPYSALLALILTDLNIDGSGAPVFSKGELAGLVVSYDASTRSASMLPVQTITRFIRDVQQPPYLGFASGGFAWKPMVDQTKRRFFGLLSDTTGGIQVTGVLQTKTGRNPLLPNDIVLELGGVAIDEQGYYEDPNWGRLYFSHLIHKRYSPGDTITVKFIRDRQMMTEDMVLSRHDDTALLIPENAEGSPEGYLVDGGFVIRELTGQMLKSGGAQWTTRTEPRLAHLYLTRQNTPEKPGERVVILSAVLPDPINIGYQHLRSIVVDSVNGTPVLNLKEVFAAVDRERGIHRLGLAGIEVDIALDAAALPTANQRIANQYRIPSLRRPAF
ncbi:MAG TPA: hypothetical protein DCS43_11130 [Verrucomicrobia bacterium]|nr:hypothetical protein [Verrucomicrobiota bacterium]